MEPITHYSASLFETPKLGNLYVGVVLGLICNLFRFNHLSDTLFTGYKKFSKLQYFRFLSDSYAMSNLL